MNLDLRGEVGDMLIAGEVLMDLVVG